MFSLAAAPMAAMARTRSLTSVAVGGIELRQSTPKRTPWLIIGAAKSGTYPGIAEDSICFFTRTDSLRNSSAENILPVSATKPT